MPTIIGKMTRAALFDHIVDLGAVGTNAPVAVTVASDEITLTTDVGLYIVTGQAGNDDISQIANFNEGMFLLLIAASGETHTLKDETGATDTEKIRLPGGTDVSFKDDECVFLYHDDTLDRWVLISGPVSGGGHTEDHDHDGMPTQKLIAANTHESVATDTHHAQSHNLDSHPTRTHANLSDAPTTAHQDEVSLAGTPDYITIAGQVITRNAVDLTADVTGLLPVANIHADIARDSELHSESHALSSHSSRPHSELSDAPTDAHHAGFIGLEDNAASAVTPAGDDRIQITDDGKVNADASGNTIALSIAEGQINHDALSNFIQNEHLLVGAIDHDTTLNYVANDHIDHSGVSITAGIGLAGGGDLTTTRNLELALEEPATATIVAGDWVVFADIGDSDITKKTTFTNFEAALTHDNLLAGTIADHDTTATGAELNTLTGSVDADGLHTHTGINLTDDIFALHAGDTYTGVHDFGAATSFEVPNADAPTAPDVAGEIVLDTLVTDWKGGQLQIFGAQELMLIPMIATAHVTVVDGHIIAYNATNDEFEMVAPSGGAVASDIIWDAKGDLAGGTGSNTAVRLAVGSDDQVLTAASGETTGMKWAAAGGHAESHNIASHSDTSATGAELNTLTDDSNADGLHQHEDFDGAISTASSADMIRLGINGNTPRVLFDEAGQVWMIDVFTDELRFFKTGSVKAAIQADGEFRLPLATAVGQGLLLGGDAELYADSAGDTLRTPDALTVDGLLTASGGIVVEDADYALELESSTEARLYFDKSRNDYWRFTRDATASSRNLRFRMAGATVFQVTSTEVIAGLSASGGAGIFRASGRGASQTEGGRILIEMANDHDGTNNEWEIQVESTDLHISLPSGGDVLVLRETGKVAEFSGVVKVDTIDELAGNAGVTIEGVLLKDSTIFTVTSAELNELTDASETTLHSHAGGAGHGTGTISDHGDVAAMTEVQGDVLYFDGSNWNRLGFGTNGHFLKTQGSGANPVWAAAGGGGNHDMLDGSVHQDSVVDEVTRGSLIVANATPKWDELIAGTAGTILQIDAADGDPAWATMSGDATIAAGGAVTVIAATTSQAGKVELATTAEANTGVATDRAVTPDALKDSRYGLHSIEDPLRLTYVNPSSSDDVTIGYISAAFTISKMTAVLAGGTSTPTVTYKILHAASRAEGSPQEVVSTPFSTVTSTTSGDEVTSFGDATIPAGRWVWLETTAKGGTVPEFHITLLGTYD